MIGEGAHAFIRECDCFNRLLICFLEQDASDGSATDAIGGLGRGQVAADG